MRSRPFLFIFALILFLAFSVSSQAREIVCAEPENGNTVLQTFNTRDLDAEQKAFLIEWTKSNRSVVLHSSTASFYFIIVPEGATADITRPGNKGHPQFSCSAPFRMMEFYCPTHNTQPLPMVTFGTVSPGTTLLFTTVLFGSYFTTVDYKFPIFSGYDYMPEYTGNLILRDNSNVFAGGADSGDDSLWDKIWGWLSDFWETFIGLFIPPDGYYDNWYAEIKAAADERFGSIFELYETLKGSFEEIRADSTDTPTFEWHIPAGQLWSGSPEIRGDIFRSAIPYLKYVKTWFTIILVIFTAIACYRRLVVMFEQ